MSQQLANHRQRFRSCRRVAGKAVPQIVQPNIGHSRVLAGSAPHRAQAYWFVPAHRGKNEACLCSVRHANKRGQHLPIEVDDLCAGLAVGQHQPRRLNPFPAQAHNFAVTSRLCAGLGKAERPVSASNKNSWNGDYWKRKPPGSYRPRCCRSRLSCGTTAAVRQKCTYPTVQFCQATSPGGFARVLRVRPGAYRAVRFLTP
jgi:hypothetical protein